jgi:hypothetical protein
VTIKTGPAGSPSTDRQPGPTNPRRIGVADANEHSPSIAILCAQDPANEHLFAPIARRLLVGVDCGVGWLRLVKNNDKTTADDLGHYKTDYRLDLNGETIGFLDIEQKFSWVKGRWPYPKVNVARFPMKHWQENRINGRPTNKLMSFKEHPHTSFYVAVRNDYAACVIVKASDIFEHGIKTIQQTKYDSRPLPIYELSNDLGTYIEDPDELASYISRKVLL